MPKFLNKRAISLAAIIAISIGFTAVADNVMHAPKNENVVQKTISSSLIARGEFQGQSEDDASGEAFVMKTARGYVLVLSYDFSLKESQSAVLGFGQNGKFVQETRFAALRANSGRQTYILPENLTPTDFTELYVWSDANSSPLSMATLN